MHLWGKTTGETTSLIQQELSVKNPRMALIGPGGERLVRFANIAMDLIHFAGRGGLGAVMGSKNLKGIVVKGDMRELEVVDRQVLKEISIWLS